MPRRGDNGFGGGLAMSGDCAWERKAVVLPAPASKLAGDPVRTMPTSQNRDMGHPAPGEALGRGLTLCAQEATHGCSGRICKGERLRWTELLQVDWWVS